MSLPFWHPALARAQIWRTMLGITLIMAIWFFGTFAILNLGPGLRQAVCAVDNALKT